MIYENLDDRRRQWFIADAYAHATGLDLSMTDEQARLPWDAEFWAGGRLVRLAEVKCRSCARLTYPTYKIDKAKVDAMLAEATRLQVECGLLVEFTDGRFKVGLSAAWLAAHAQVSVIHRKNREGETPDPAWEWANTLWKPMTALQKVDGVLRI